MQNMSLPWWGKMVVYWLEDQIEITFYSDLPPDAQKKDIVASLHLDNLNGFLGMMGYKLHAFQEHDVRHTLKKREPEHKKFGHKEGNDDLNSLVGKYVFRHPSGQGSLVKCFFHVKQTSAYAMVGMPAMQGMDAMYGNGGIGDTANTTGAVINLINSNRNAFKQEADISILAASPNWLCGGTPASGGCTTHGCPQSPPVPVREDYSDWHITLPDLSPTMQARTGAGVTVFVLDTRPSPEQIAAAARRAGAHNMLLQTIARQIDGEAPAILLKDPDSSLPDILDLQNPQQPMTGRDICGRLVGYDVTDHGLFVTGIIRDIVPDAKIECVRVLNDFGVGTVGVLVEALEEIHHRMSPIDPNTGKEGDLYNKPVVINLSLVAILHQEEMVQWWSAGNFSNQVQITSDTEPLAHGLRVAIQSLVGLGAVIVGAAGNDSDVRQCHPPTKPQSLIVSTQRMKPRYPAAYPEVIAVGAVDKTGHAAMYSNDPVAVGSLQHNGVATFGGGVPVPVFPPDLPCDHSHAPCDPFDDNCMTNVDLTKMDTLVGVYSSACYPALSATDEQPSYEAPNDYSWAYWSGTSFATPIISAVAARLLEELVASNYKSSQWYSEVMRAFTNGLGQGEWLTGKDPLPLQPEFSRDAGVNVGLLNAQQVGSSKRVAMQSVDVGEKVGV